MSGFYAGILPESAIPANAVGTEFDHSETYSTGRVVKYYRYYLPYPGYDHLAGPQKNPLQGPDLQNKGKIEDYDRLFNYAKKVPFLPFEPDYSDEKED